MDGFFVAKFKVEKRTKGGKANGVIVDEDGDIGESKVDVNDAGDTTFNDDADKAIIEGERADLYIGPMLILSQRVNGRICSKQRVSRSLRSPVRSQ